MNANSVVRGRSVASRQKRREYIVRNSLKYKKMTLLTVASKGQTTIPGEIRRHLKLKPGDRVEFFVEPDGKVVLMPATVDASELKGATRSRSAASIPGTDERGYPQACGAMITRLDTNVLVRYPCKTIMLSHTRS
jgi:antitoxin PrlF